MKDKLEKKKIVEDIRKGIEVSKGTRIWTDYVNALKLNRFKFISTQSAIC